MQLINEIIKSGASSAMTLEEIIKTEISEWQNSPERKLMLEGEKYYKGDSDIIKRQRTVIGDDGRMVNASNLANNKLIP